MAAPGHRGIPGTPDHHSLGLPDTRSEDRLAAPAAAFCVFQKLLARGNHCFAGRFIAHHLNIRLLRRSGSLTRKLVTSKFANWALCLCHIGVLGMEIQLRRQ